MDICHQVIKYLGKMDFSLTQESNLEGDKNIQLIEFSNSLKEYFIIKSYGEDLNHFVIGIICVKPEFETFFKVRKPRYKAIDKIKLLDGNTVELIGVYGYDIKLNFNEFVSATETESRKILAQEILNSLSNLEDLPKKVKDFDKERFKEDIEQFFKSEKLI
jgi:hypothetical protein